MAYNFNDNSPGGRLDTDRRAGATTTADRAEVNDAAAAPAEGAPSAEPVTAGFARFNSCRWQQPKDEGTAAFCTHREVKPYAGTAGFDADAWCPECQYYKLRRAPKKRTPGDEYSY